MRIQRLNPSQKRKDRDGWFWRAAVIGVEVLYGFGALIAVLLFAYLVFALICAEEF